MSQRIVLYDLACRGKPRCWSRNTWKTRLVLNYKDLPYKTEWVRFMQIKPTLEALPLPANPPGSWTAHSLPAIGLPSSGQYYMDSAKIAPVLEELKPMPSLHLDEAFDQEMDKALTTIAYGLVGVYMPIIQRKMVTEEDSAWHEQNRTERFGMSLSELERTKGGEQAWEAAQPGIDRIKELMRDRRAKAGVQGPFSLGQDVTYADFQVVATMAMFVVLDHDLWTRFLKAGGDEFVQLWEAARKWTDRDD